MADKPTTDFRWKRLHQLLMSADYAEDYNSPNAAASWDANKGEWVLKGSVNCITSVNFFLGYLLNKGGKGYNPQILDNLVRAGARGTGFSDHFHDLELAFAPGDTTTIKALGTDDSRYSKTDRWPYWDMPFGLTEKVTCKCGLHVSPKFVLDNKGSLARVNVASVSLASGEPVNALTRAYRGGWGGRDKEKTLPLDNTKLRWEYTVMLLFNLKGNLFVYHHGSNPRTRWRTFENQASAFVLPAGSPRIQDSLWLIWRLPDKAWQAANPSFFQDDDGSEWSPEK